jgi:hypothetical protein
VTSFTKDGSTIGASFVNKPAQSEVDISARVTWGRTSGGPNGYLRMITEPSTASGVMLRESLTALSSRYVLIRSKRLAISSAAGAADSEKWGKVKNLGRSSVPIHLQARQSGNEVKLFTSADGQSCGTSVLVLPTIFKKGTRPGLFLSAPEIPFLPHRRVRLGHGEGMNQAT